MTNHLNASSSSFQASPIRLHPSFCPSPGQPLQRTQFITLAQTALAVGESRYCRRLALAWLAAYPGDLHAGLFHAQAWIQEGRPTPAIPILEGLCQTDPEFIEAQELLSLARRATGSKEAATSAAHAAALGGKPDPKTPLPKEVGYIQQARQALAHGQFEIAERYIHQALTPDSTSPLAAVTHLRTTLAQPDVHDLAIRGLSEAYHERWPDCVAFTLALAAALMDGGDSDRAVELLHQAVAQDVTGQVAQRLWGPAHPYRALWPDPIEINAFGPTPPQDLPIPAAVAAALGWNQLPAKIPLPTSNPNSVSRLDGQSPDPQAAADCGATQPIILTRSRNPHSARTIPHTPTPHFKISTPSSDLPAPNSSLPTSPSELPTIQSELESVAVRLKRPSLAKTDGRFPVYVVFTTLCGLEAQYGSDAAAVLDEVMKRLVDAVRTRKKWGAMVYYADDPPAGLSPAKPTDPWSLKLALTDLDDVLRKRGEMIGAVLIVGGPEIIPFHHLPNPLDDNDVDVPSDNPYATRDENYFIPEWAVGRLPGGAGRDPTLLLDCLERMTKNHLDAAHPTPWYSRCWELILTLVRGRQLIQPNLGYSAAIWRRASLLVFRPIGDPQALLVSPPIQAPIDSGTAPASRRNRNGKVTISPLPDARLGYFNLHGVPDAAEWFGHRDPTEPGESGEANGSDYPVALRPQDIGCNGNGSHARETGAAHPMQVVFSEACYGAHILNKTVDEALALKFLASGLQAIVGSTTTSYGSITTPLIAADLLGHDFWNYLCNGLPAGEALRRAKIRLAKEMHTRQGYLDGEDQKTLISFVLYGDPLAQPFSPSRVTKDVLRSVNPPAQVKAICDRAVTDDTHLPPPVPPEVLSHVKYVVAQYLPGMLDAQVLYTQEHTDCAGTGHQCPTAQMGAKAYPDRPPSRRVVTLSKRIERATQVHREFARLTLDSQGKLVKLVVSR